MITEKFDDLFRFAKKSKIKAGDGLKEGIYPFYTSSATLSKRIDVFQEVRISLIFGTGGQASVHYVDEQFSTSTDCIVAYKKEDKDFNEKFVFYYLFGNIHILERGFKGAGLKHISKKYIQNLDIPILPIKTQNRIVALLDKVNALVQKREESITQLDELLRAQFLDMFGDPILNTKNWDISKLSEICNLERGRFSPRPRNDPSYFNGEYPFIQTGDISNSNFRLSEYTQTLNSKGIIGIAPKDNLCNNYFIEMVLRFYKEYLIDKAPSAARANINLKILNKLDIISPSLEAQNDYEAFNNKIESQKESLIQSKTELNHLYNSLLQDAFKGKIEVSKEDVKKKDLIMPEIKKKKGEKVDITHLDLATYFGVPDEITSRREKWMFDLISLDEFYQFLLKDTFKKEEAFTLQDIEEKLHHFFYHRGDMDFPNASWQQIIFKFLKAKPPLLKQIFEKETGTVKLKLTDETFKA